MVKLQIGTAGTDNGYIRLSNQTGTAYYGDIYTDVSNTFNIKSVNQDLYITSGARSSWNANGGGWSSGINLSATNPFTYSTGNATFVPMTATFNTLANNSIGLGLNFTYNQTGTAGSTDLLINRTETALGSGTQYLMQAQVAGVSKFVIQNTGNVGIGTTSPSQLLTVGSAGLFNVSSAGNVYGRKWDNSFYCTVFKMEHQVNQMFFTGYGFNAYPAAGGSVTFNNANTASSDMIFRTTGNLLFKTGAGIAEYMRVTTSGNVGIGTTSPSSKLQINTATDVSARFRSITDGAGTHMDIFSANDAANAYKVLSINASNLLLNSDSLGNVGIGTTSPNANALLDISSTTKAFMPPRMTTTQKAAIASPTAGMVVYDATLNKLSVYTGAVWETVTSI